MPTRKMAISAGLSVMLFFANHSHVDTSDGSSKINRHRMPEGKEA
jgi:hypothetical protein